MAMAENKRLVQLLEKELDGALSSVERDELERLIRLEPARRREREVWRRVAAGIAEPVVAPRIETARMTARVLNERSRALRVRSFRPFRALLAASTLAAIAMVFFASRHVPVHVDVQKPAVARIVKPPVDVFVDESFAEDDRSALVEIRF
jgi:hypothetical protein